MIRHLSIAQYKAHLSPLQVFLCTRSLYDPCPPDDTAALHDTLTAGDEPCTVVVIATPCTLEGNCSA